MLSDMKISPKAILMIICGLIVISMMGCIGVLTKKIEALNHDIILAENNVRAYALENSTLKDRNREFTMTVDQLNYTNDSLVSKMNEVRRQLKVKDANLERLEYLLSTAKRVDTLWFEKQIFVESVEHIDTTIRDDRGWYECTLTLEYPNLVAVAPQFTSEKYIVTSWHKEPIKTPRKTAFGRFFQKKMKVLEVEVVEKNPYITNDSQKFIELSK